MIYNIWGFFAFYIQVLQKVEEGGKGAWERESKHKEETPGTFSQVKIIPLELFLTLFLFFFPLLDVKITKKKFFQENRNHNIYTTSIWQLPLCICKNVVFSLHVQIILILEVFFLSSDSCIENLGGQK